MTNRKLRALAVCLGAAVVVLAACGSDNEATTSPTAELTATEAVTTTTPEPTEQPTLKPTSEPTPDAAIAAELAYNLEILDWLAQGQVLLDGVGEIANSAAPFSASSEALALALTVAADAWRDDAYEFDAPPKYDEAQMWVERAGETMAESLDDFWLGIKFINVDLIDSATEKMGTATEYINNANSALGAID